MHACMLPLEIPKPNTLSSLESAVMMIINTNSLLNFGHDNRIGVIHQYSEHPVWVVRSQTDIAAYAT